MLTAQERTEEPHLFPAPATKKSLRPRHSLALDIYDAKHFFGRLVTKEDWTYRFCSGNQESRARRWERFKKKLADFQVPHERRVCEDPGGTSNVVAILLTEGADEFMRQTFEQIRLAEERARHG